MLNNSGEHDLDIESRLRSFTPIRHLPAQFQDKLLAAATVTAYEPWQTIYAEAGSDGLVHYLVDGSVELLWQGRLTRSLNHRDRGAREPLDPPGRKRYTLRARSGATIASFRRSLLERFVEQVEADAAKDRLEVSDISATTASDWMIRMLQSELFARLPAVNIQRIFARMETLSLAAGEVVFRQGSAGDFYYVIEHGYCEVSRAIAGGRGHIHLADLGPGTAFGEEALVADCERDATVTMLSDGRLMRLARDDFVELIRDPVLEPLALDEAERRVADGAAWLDIRYPEAHAARAIAGSENLPLNMLRLQSARLDHDTRWVVCGEDPSQCAVAAFLLTERGFDASFLDESLSAALAERPALTRTEDAAAATIVFLPGKETMTEFPPDRSGEHHPHEEPLPLEDTLTRIANLCTHEQAQREMDQSTPREDYADTSSGQALADIIDELAEQHESLGSAAAAPRGPVPGHDRVDGSVLDAAISTLMGDLEQRLRAEVARAVGERERELEA
ncbi:MAG: cyclic nucleotide-binding domain-containing protein, partial [Gammaproteobacteria bacterium]